MNFKQISIILSYLSFDLMVNYTPVKEKELKLLYSQINNLKNIPNIYNNEVSESEYAEYIDSTIDDSDDEYVKTLIVFSEEEITEIPDIFSEEEDIGIPDISSEENNLYFDDEYIEASSQIINIIDNSIDTNEDYYKFSFDNYDNENENLEFKSYIDALEIGVIENNEIFTNIWEDQSNIIDEFDNKTFNPLDSYYNTCIDSKLINEKNNKTLINLLNQLKIYENKENYRDLDGLTNLIIDIHNYDSDAFFNIGIIDDLENQDINKFYLIQSGLGLPNKEFYENHEYISLYKDIVKCLFINIFKDHRTKKDINSLADLAVEFEKKLANINVSTEDLKNINEIYNKTNIIDLSKKYPYINWKLYFEKRFKEYNHCNKINDDILIIDTTPQYFKKLNNLISETDNDSLLAYSELCIIRTYVEYVTDNIQLPIKLLEKLINGFDEDSPKSKMCAEIINKRIDLVADKIYEKPNLSCTTKLYNEFETSFNDLVTCINNIYPLNNEIIGNLSDHKLIHSFDNSYKDYNWWKSWISENLMELSQFHSNSNTILIPYSNEKFDQNKIYNEIYSDHFYNIPDEFLFIAYGHLWYNKSKTETIIQQIVNKDNDLSKFHINESFNNSNLFNKFFFK